MGAQFFKTQPSYASLEYTKRQQDIINEVIPLEEVRTTELAAILKKARARYDETTYEIVQSLYDLKTMPEEYKPSYTLEEARTILQALTPWQINWDV